MDWVPIVLVVFKLAVFGTCMFFAVKWHYDKDRSQAGKGAVLRTVGSVAAVLLLLLVAAGLFSFVLLRTLHLDLSFPG